MEAASVGVGPGETLADQSAKHEPEVVKLFPASDIFLHSSCRRPGRTPRTAPQVFTDRLHIVKDVLPDVSGRIRVLVSQTAGPHNASPQCERISPSFCRSDLRRTPVASPARAVAPKRPTIAVARRVVLMFIRFLWFCPGARPAPRPLAGRTGSRVRSSIFRDNRRRRVEVIVQGQRHDIDVRFRSADERHAGKMNIGGARQIDRAILHEDMCVA